MRWLLALFVGRGVRWVVSIGMAVVLVPVILNLGFGYADTIERVGEGEDVTPTNMMDAATQGIRPGTTSERVERLFADRGGRPIPSTVPGERCTGYDTGVARQALAVCFTQRDGRWIVSSSSLRTTDG